MNNEILDALRYKSEGTDLDFKQEQYRFAGGNEYEKSEMLKDILAMANAWRDGTGYILLGLKENRPHLAEVMGITESIDDSRLQQFVNMKVTPKLTFRYEEHLYEGKTVGVIAIPKQPRPFFIATQYGKLKPKIVYVRRGSSTDEADPLEAGKMMQADIGRSDVKVDLSVLTSDNDNFAETFECSYLHFPDLLPDYVSPPEKHDPMHIRTLSIWHDNRDFWRELGEFVRMKSALVEMQFVLFNRSEVQLSNAKLEVTVEPLDGQSVEMLEGCDIPEMPKSHWSNLQLPSRAMMRLNGDRFEVNKDGTTTVCHVRFGALLPGEQGRSADTLALVPLGPGRLRLRFRILAGELPAPIEMERLLETKGDVHSLDLDGFKTFLRECPERIRAVLVGE